MKVVDSGGDDALQFSHPTCEGLAIGKALGSFSRSLLFMKSQLLLAALLSTFTQAEDIRLQPPKDLNGYFPFDPPSSLSEWDVRKEQVRRQILVSQGLWPMPTKHR
jgi:hypothetical protein